MRTLRVFFDGKVVGEIELKSVPQHDDETGECVSRVGITVVDDCNGDGLPLRWICQARLEKHV